MKITHNKVGQNLNLNDTRQTGKASTSTPLNQQDTKVGAGLGQGSAIDGSTVAISSRAQDIKRATEIARATPDVNEAKVSRLQKLIDEGKYKTDASAIADRMVDEQMKWE